MRLGLPVAAHARILTPVALRRELISINVGGFGGAPLRGELGSYRELYSGESGPRVELLELLDWVKSSLAACTAVING